MTWEKLGQIPAPTHYATCPFIKSIIGDFIGVYFSDRDEHNRSRTRYAVIDMVDRKLLHLMDQPVLVPGEQGRFDDSGAMGCCVIEMNKKRLMYYIGWNLGVTVPFRNSVGVALEVSDGRFVPIYPGPILDRTKYEPHFVASCFVLKDPWRLWYTSCVGWPNDVHKYHIKFAEGDNYDAWGRHGHVAINFRDKSEIAISRPWVIPGSPHRMWYSYRGDKYRIGYAESQDGELWDRKDHLGLDVSESGWDSEMVEYPCVFEYKGRLHMLYNGNGYGRTGFGLAVLQ